MYAVEFETQITNGHIVVPEEFRKRLSGAVRVLVLVETDNGLPPSRSQEELSAVPASRTTGDDERRPGESLLDYRMRNPYVVKDFKPLSREEMHERRADLELYVTKSGEGKGSSDDND